MCFTVQLLRISAISDRRSSMMRLRRIYDPVHKTLWKQAPNGLLNGSCTYISNAQLPVPMRLGETPVPIPNTTVKTQTADGTALETMWESRWAPDQKGM